MAGHATEVAPIIENGSAIRVPVLGQGSPVLVIDARPKVQWTEQELAEAVEAQQRKAGALVALVRSETEATWAEIRRELNEAAGGQASTRVMVMAHHALRAHQALEVQTLLADVAAGKSLDDLRADAHGQRNQSGLSVIATQALNQAYEAARAEAKQNQGSPTQQLMSRIGVGAARPNVTDVQGGSQVTHGSTETHPGSVPPGLEIASLSPLTPPGGDQFGSPASVVSLLCSGRPNCIWGVQVRTEGARSGLGALNAGDACPACHLGALLEVSAVEYDAVHRQSSFTVPAPSGETE